MEKLQFEKALELKDRILQLEVIKNYLYNFLQKKPIRIELYTHILGQVNANPILINGANSDFYKNENYQQTDSEFIIQQIQNRINKLQEEFDKL